MGRSAKLVGAVIATGLLSPFVFGPWLEGLGRYLGYQTEPWAVYWASLLSGAVAVAVASFVVVEAPRA